jgi:hypothetical protein
MQGDAGTMANEQHKSPQQRASTDAGCLSRHYRQIGISAVASAAAVARLSGGPLVNPPAPGGLLRDSGRR